MAKVAVEVFATVRAAVADVCSWRVCWAPCGCRLTSCGCPLCRDVGDAELSLADVVGDAAALSADIGGDVQPDPPKKDLVSKIAELKARRTMLVNFFSLTSDSCRRCLFPNLSCAVEGLGMFGMVSQNPRILACCAKCERHSFAKCERHCKNSWREVKWVLPCFACQGKTSPNESASSTRSGTSSPIWQPKHLAIRAFFSYVSLVSRATVSCHSFNGQEYGKC